MQYEEAGADAEGLLAATERGLRALGGFEGNVMVLPGDMPLLQPDTTLLCLEAMIQARLLSASSVERASLGCCPALATPGPKVHGQMSFII